MSDRRPERLHRFAHRCMGSALRLTVAGGSRRQALAARDAAWAEMAATDDELSRFSIGSSLTSANLAAGNSRWQFATPRLLAMLHAAHRAQRLTDGRFDARVIGTLEAIGERGGVPLPRCRAAGTGWLKRRGRSCFVRLAVPVDSGGIGKGLGLRWAMDAARSAADAELTAGRSKPGLLLEAGGDLLVDGPGPGGGGWMVGIEDPFAPDELLATVTVRDGAVATSSTSHRLWRHAGDAVHHLIDPSTDAPAATGLVAVTVAAADPAWAEVWTKALFLAGSARIGDEARSRALAAWWVEDDGSLHMTPAARQVTSWVRGEAPAA